MSDEYEGPVKFNKIGACKELKESFAITNKNYVPLKEKTVFETPAVPQPIAPPVVEEDTTCVICFDKPRNATIVHGKTGHVCCCLDCAEMLFKNHQPCPMCRQKITVVVQNFSA